MLAAGDGRRAVQFTEHMVAVNHHDPSTADRDAEVRVPSGDRAAHALDDLVELARITVHELRGSLILIAVLLGLVAMLSWR